MGITYLRELELENDEALEIHRCPQCRGLIGIDAHFLDQVTDRITCPMCKVEVRLEMERITS